MPGISNEAKLPWGKTYSWFLYPKFTLFFLRLPTYHPILAGSEEFLHISYIIPKSVFCQLEYSQINSIPPRKLLGLMCETIRLKYCPTHKIPNKLMGTEENKYSYIFPVETSKKVETTTFVLKNFRHGEILHVPFRNVKVIISRYQLASVVTSNFISVAIIVEHGKKPDCYKVEMPDPN